MIISGISGFILVWIKGMPKCWLTFPAERSAEMKTSLRCGNCAPLVWAPYCTLLKLLSKGNWETSVIRLQNDCQHQSMDEAFWLLCSRTLLFPYSDCSLPVSWGLDTRKDILHAVPVQCILLYLSSCTNVSFFYHQLFKGTCLKSSEILLSQLLCLDYEWQKCHCVLFHLLRVDF